MIKEKEKMEIKSEGENDEQNEDNLIIRGREKNVVIKKRRKMSFP